MSVTYLIPHDNQFGLLKLEPRPGIKGSPDLFYRIQGQRRSPAISAEPGPVFYHNNVSMVWPAGLLGGPEAPH